MGVNISSYIYNSIQLFSMHDFKGWGRKKTGRYASWCQKEVGGKVTLYEDGFIRSLGLGVDGCKAWSYVEDEIGIYYDATTPSKLEKILNSYDFQADKPLMQEANKAIKLIIKNKISKYNNSEDFDSSSLQKSKNRVLIISQTGGDASLKYGLAEKFTTKDMIDAAIEENPEADIYLKIHPDVLSGKKVSDVDVEYAKERTIIIDKNVNPISLLQHFTKVYTKTSQMGFEALLVGCECVCFGMPFYAGWGISSDKQNSKRRERVLSIEEVFAASYILYTKYQNPFTKKEIDIFETIEGIIELKKEAN